MALDEMAGKCRACQEDTSEESQISIYSDKNLKDIFHDVTSIKIDREDKLPGVLCSKCHTRLLDAHQFRQMCAVSALKFHKILVQENLMPKRSYVLKETKKHKSAVKKLTTKVKQIKEEFEEDDPISPSFHPTEYVSVEFPKGELLLPKREIEELDSETHQENLDEDEVIKNKIDRENIPETADVDKNLVCNICKKVFQRSSALMTHLSRVHRNVKMKICLICEKDCLTTSKLEAHLTKEHDVTEGLACKICGKNYQHRVNLLMHIKFLHSGTGPVEKPKNFICEECGKAFPTRNFLMRHSYSHSGLRPFACSHCPKRFVTRSKLRDHMLRHAGIKNHVCTICGQRRTTAAELKMHMNCHTKERTYSCQYCDKVFTGRANKIRHVNVVHLGTLSYPCTTCGRAFGKQETLKHHQMTHTGEKPEVCNICGKRFIQKVALKKHMQTHEKHK